MSELQKQPTMKPTRKVMVGGANGVSMLVGLNLMADVFMERAYGGLDMVPESELRLIMWAVSAIPVGWTIGWSYIAKARGEEEGT
jgi:hypothetical protein